MPSIFEDFFQGSNDFLDSTVNLFTTGDFATSRRRAREKEKKQQGKEAAVARTNEQLFTQILKDPTISNVTRGELLSSFSASGEQIVASDFGSIESTFLTAQAGVAPTFKARQKTEEFLRVTRDKPGASQTRFVDSVRNVGI
jgi:hypothetical protein